jgi:putative hydrolase of HD superfamily
VIIRQIALLLGASISLLCPRPAQAWYCSLLLAESALSPAIAEVENQIHPKVFSKILLLRGVHRRGWLKRGIPTSEAEDVFTHTLKMVGAAQSLAKQRPDLDLNRLVQMILIHDLAETIYMDVTPSDGISRQTKIQNEREAFALLVREDAKAFLPVISLWEEFESQKTPEAVIAFQLDKLDAAIQAIRYDRQDIQLQTFILTHSSS